MGKKMDMMFDLKHDRFEVQNLLGKGALDITDHAILTKAEHLRCLLLDWMIRLDGGGNNDQNTRYFSDPANNFGEGNGDINEIRQRQRWTQIGLWVSHGKTNNNNDEENTNTNNNPLEFGKVSWTKTTTRSSSHGDDGEFIRHEWFYLGTRFDETFTIISLTIEGMDGDKYFSVDEAHKQELLSGKEIGRNSCESIRVTFRTIAAMTNDIINSNSDDFDASLVLELLRHDDDEDDDSLPSHDNDDDSSPSHEDDADVVTTTSGSLEFLSSLTSNEIKYAFIGGLIGIVLLFLIVGCICYKCFGKSSAKRTYRNMDMDSDDNAADEFYDEVDEGVDGT